MEVSVWGIKARFGACVKWLFVWTK